MTPRDKLNSLLTAANTKTGESDTTLTDAMQTLIDGYGQGGGGGAVEIASGTFTPSTTAVSKSIAIGNKMAQTDFLVLVYADDETEIPNDGTWKGMIGVLVCDKTFGYFDLHEDVSNKAPTGKFTYKVNQDGTITDREAPGIYGGSASLRNNAAYVSYPADISHNKVTRSSSGFTLTLRWTSQNFMSGITYNYKVLYYGSDPSNDIVEVA